jgi:hypothetical protein
MRLAPTNGVEVADRPSETPGVAAANRVSEGLREQTAPPGRFPGRRNNGHTTSGLDFALQDLADRLHPTG